MVPLIKVSTSSSLQLSPYNFLQVVPLELAIEIVKNLKYSDCCNSMVQHMEEDIMIY